MWQKLFSSSYLFLLLQQPVFWLECVIPFLVMDFTTYIYLVVQICIFLLLSLSIFFRYLLTNKMSFCLLPLSLSFSHSGGISLLLQSFIYSGYKLVVDYVCCKYFLPIHSWSLPVSQEHLNWVKWVSIHQRFAPR